MKAILCKSFGAVEDLVLTEIDDPAPGAGDVVVRASAIGVNFPDGLLVQGLYQMKPALPFIPGMEVAGSVEAVGDGVTHIRPGDRVAGLVTHGAYAERVCVPAPSVFPLPDTMPDDQACALLCAYGTAHHALKQRATLQPGEALVVAGAAGSTGLAAIQIGKAMGARVLALASTPEKRAAARNAGADEVAAYDDVKGAIRAFTGGRGADVVFDPVGGDVFDAASRAMAPGGRLLVIGFASGTIPKLAVNLALVKEYAVVGVFWGAFTAREPALFAENMRELFAWHGAGAVRPVIDGRFPLAEAPQVLARILDRDAIGKSVLVPQG